MAFNKNSNGYTFLFAIVMVVLVGAILASLSLSLKPMQKANQAEKKMMNILGAIGVPSERGRSKPVFAEYVTERISIDSEGRQVSVMGGEVNTTDATDPFNIDVKKDYRSHKPRAICPGQPATVVPALRMPEGRRGPTSWCPSWARASGVRFGATSPSSPTCRPSTAPFRPQDGDPWPGRRNQGRLLPGAVQGQDPRKVAPHFSVVKGGAPTTDYSVDGITGGTITSKGVGEMVDRTMGIYLKYFQSAPKAQK